MPTNEQLNNESNQDDVLFQWYIPNKTDHQRGNVWYVFMLIIAIAIIVFSILTGNFLFALIIILAIYIVFLQSYLPTQKIIFQITDEGLVIGNQQVPFSKIEKFYIIYKPPQVKKLFIDIKGFAPNFSVPLLNKNPLVIRKALLEYIDEDLEKEEEAMGDQLERILKL